MRYNEPKNIYMWVRLLACIGQTWKRTGKGNIAFQKLPLSVEIWDIEVDDDQVLLATTEGVYTLTGNTPKRITPENMALARSLFRSQRFPNVMYVGLENGLAGMTKVQGEWQYVGKISDIVHRVMHLEETSSYIWATGNRASRFTFTTDPFRPTDQLTIGKEHGIPGNMRNIKVCSIDGKIFFGTNNGIYRYEENPQRFLPDSTFGADFANDSRFAYALHQDNRGNIWVSSRQYEGNTPITGRQNGRLVKQKEGGYRYDHSLLDPIDDYAKLFVTDEEGDTWIGTSKGLYRFNPTAAKDVFQPFTTLIRKVILQEDSVIYMGGAPDTVNRFQPQKIKPEIPTFTYGNREFTFEFAATHYEYVEENRYSYQLEGYESSWSEWKKVTAKAYTGLREGKYAFRVRSRNIYGTEGIEAVYYFKILPPWYRTSWAYVLYVILGLAVLALLIGLQARQHQRKLEAKEAELERERTTAERLRQVDRLKDEFLANTSHELRTPLNGIIGLAEGLYEGAGGEPSEAMKENLNLIISSGKRLNSLVNDLLDYSKLRNQELSLQPKALTLRPLADVVVQGVMPLVKGKNLELINDIPLDLDRVMGDENRLLQVFYNLIGNAIKFTEEGSIRLSAHKSANAEIEVRVADTGIGIPKEKQALIFEAFQQADGSIARQFGGSGLGLSITQKLIELHGGSISVESIPGEGSTFSFRLPAVPILESNQRFSPSQTGSISEAPERKLPRLNRSLQEKESVGFKEIVSPTGKNETDIKILIVDDEPINIQVIKNHLLQKPFQLFTATHGEEALHTLAKHPSIDVVLLDVMMPRMSGYEVCKKIREHYLPSELPVIMITARDQVADLVTGLAAGANDYLSKPFSKDEFLARLDTHLNLHRIHQTTHKFVPTEFIRSLGRKDINDVHLGDHVEEEVTVLFSDIRDYTTLSEEMSPTDNFRFVNSYVGRMGPIIQQNNGFVNQYLGDGIMAIFMHEIEDALQAAINMQHHLQMYNEARKIKHRIPIRMGIGMHTGPLIMGIIGDHSRLEASTISDTVNTSSRMETLTKYFNAQILLSESTLQQLQHASRYNYRYLGPVRVKGKKYPVGVYECFDGDPEEILELKHKTKALFDEGMAYYLNKSFEQAVLSFQEVLRIFPEDTAAQLFRSRATQYRVAGVDPDWVGIELMDEK